MINKFKSKLSINIKGKNVLLFIRKLINNKIELLNINYTNYNDVTILIYVEDYKIIEKLKTIYDISIIDFKGIEKFKRSINDYKYLIIFIIIGFSIIYLLSNMIFSIEVVTNDSLMKEKITEILREQDIKKYRFKKNYNYLQEVKKEILNIYKDEIEWIEIENLGTKYIIKYEPRIILNKEQNTNARHIVSSKDAMILDVDASIGEIVRKKNDYVKKGNIIVSGNIYLNDSVKGVVSATGIVYGEVWYELTVSYPFNYYEKKETGKKKKLLSIKAFDREINLFDFNKYKNKIKNDEVIIKNNLLPFSINIQQQKEVNLINENNTPDIAFKKAILLGKKKLIKKLENDEYIIDYKVLDKYVTKKDITLRIFFSVYENITDYIDIINDKDNNETGNN